MEQDARLLRRLPDPDPVGRMSDVLRIPISCPATHKHGSTRTCYVRHACRCEACIARNRKYESDRKAEVLAARKANAYTKPEVTTSRALVEISLSARDAAMVADVLAERAERVALASRNAGVQAPILRNRAQSIHLFARQLQDAAERIRR